MLSIRKGFQIESFCIIEDNDKIICKIRINYLFLKSTRPTCAFFANY